MNWADEAEAESEVDELVMVEEKKTRKKSMISPKSH